jgi:hypothetical protein
LAQYYIKKYPEYLLITERSPMRTYYKGTYMLLSFFLLACTSEDNGARKQLETARRFYNQREYIPARQQLDSLKIKYPKAFLQLQEGLALLDSVRRGENELTISLCDSLIRSFEPDVEQRKKQFSFQKDKQYQETGNYIPEKSVTAYITGTTLRSGVKETGQVYIESIFVGGQKHNKMKISTKDGSFIESLAVNDDGLNYRFVNGGKTCEVLHFTGADENGMAKFIFVNMDRPLTATIEGQGKYTYTLSQSIKSAIAKSYQLSVMMSQLDSLKTEKEKAEYRIYYLDNKKNAVDSTKP